MLLTYGDGVCDIDLEKLIAFHRQHGKLATVTAVRPPARFGELKIDRRPREDVRREAADRRRLDQRRLLRARAAGRRLHRGGRHRVRARTDGAPRRGRQLAVYEHHGFWQCMDTLRDVRQLEEMWQTGHAPWAMPGGTGR